jgi:hypothetical protein
LQKKALRQRTIEIEKLMKIHLTVRDSIGYSKSRVAVPGSEPAERLFFIPAGHETVAPASWPAGVLASSPTLVSYQPDLPSASSANFSIFGCGTVEPLLTD